MGIEETFKDYFSQKETADKIVAKQVREVGMGLDQAIYTNLADGDGLDMSKFGERLDNIARDMEATFRARAKEYLQIPDAIASDPIKGGLIVLSYNGMTIDAIKETVEGALKDHKDPTDSSVFKMYAQRFMGPPLKVVKQSPYTKLKIEDSERVVEAVKVGCHVDLDPKADVFKNVYVLGGLLDQFKEYGVLTPRFISDNKELFDKGKKGPIVRMDTLTTPPL